MANGKSDGLPNGNLTRTPVAQPTRQRSVSHPRYNLQQAEKLAQAAFDIGPRHCDQDKVARAVGYKNAQNGAFVALKASASQFGLIIGRGQYLSVTEEWIDVFNSEDSSHLQAARQKAMLQPDLYKQLLDDYKGRQFPSLERLTRELYLNQKYGILKDAASLTAEVFIESANYAGLLDAKGYLRLVDMDEETTDALDIKKQRGTESQTGTQQLDSRRLQSPARSLTAPTSTAPLASSGNEAVILPEGLDRHEVQLKNGKRAYFFIPVPLPFGERERLKKYIGHILEYILEEDSSSDQLRADMVTSDDALPNDGE